VSVAELGAAGPGTTCCCRDLPADGFLESARATRPLDVVVARGMAVDWAQGAPANHENITRTIANPPPMQPALMGALAELYTGGRK
jgi:hypothetical protein